MRSRCISLDLRNAIFTFKRNMTNNDDGVEKMVCCIIIRKRNTTNVFLTGFEFPHLFEAEDMASVILMMLQVQR